MEGLFDNAKRNELFYTIITRLNSIDSENLKAEIPLSDSELYSLKKDRLTTLFADIELSAKSVDLEELYPAIDWATERKMKHAFQSWCMSNFGGIAHTIHELTIYGSAKGAKPEIRIKTTKPGRFYDRSNIDSGLVKLFETIANQEVTIEINSSNPFN